MAQTKADRSATAKKAAATRKRNEAKAQTAASNRGKKAAATRKRNEAKARTAASNGARRPPPPVRARPQSDPPTRPSRRCRGHKLDRLGR